MKYIKQYMHAFFAAFTFLTNLKLPFYKDTYLSDDVIQKSVIFYPLVGFIYGVVLYLFSVLSLNFFKLDKTYLSLLIVGIPFVLNNFLHFDGLMDSLDACLANKIKDERLEILKDSHIGSFALGGAMIFFGFKFLLVLDFLQINQLLVYLIIIPVLSRFLVVLISYNAYYPRKTGTGSFLIGKVSTFHMVQTIFITSIILIVWSLYFHVQSNTLLILAAFIFLFATMCRLYAKQKIGGITGDVLGASLELSEVLMFIVILVT